MDDWQKLLITRWQELPEKFVICIDAKSFSKDEIIEHIKLKDEVYEIISKCEREYFDRLKDGSLIEILKEDNK